MEFILIAIIIIFVLEYTKKINTRKFIGDSEPYFKFLMENDYKFLLNVKYGENVDIDKLYGTRLRNGFLTIVVLLFVFVLSNPTFINILLSLIIGYIVFKEPYIRLQTYYRKNLFKKLSNRNSLKFIVVILKFWSNVYDYCYSF